MKHRTAGALIGVLVILCGGLVVSIGYPVTTSEPHAATPSGEQFSAPTSGAFSATGSIVVDGDVNLAFEGVVTPNGTWYQKVVEENVTSAEYRPTPNGTIYERLTIVGRDRASRVRQAILEDDDSDLVGESTNGDRQTFLVERNTTVSGEPLSGTASVLVRSLAVAGYEASRPGSTDVSVYEPRSGWYEGRATYRLSGATGELRVDPATNRVQSANVSWKVTSPAGTYLEYVLVRLTTDDPTTYRITFQLEPGNYTHRRPSWIDRTNGS